AKNFEKRQKIKKEILRKKRVIPSVSFLHSKTKNFFVLSGKYGLSKFIASYRSAFLLPVFNT
ncbi:hypothetical protein, partial [Enterococcus faecium]